MRIAFLCKRRYTGKDVIGDKFGRLYEMPYHLARHGHHVRTWCLDYHSGTSVAQIHEAPPGVLEWRSHGVRGIRSLMLAFYPRRLGRELAKFSPDLIIGASDIPHVALAAWGACRLRVPCVVDLYDNFESFGMARLPGLTKLLAASVRQASLVTTVSNTLRQKVIEEYDAGSKVLVMPNGIDSVTFHSANKAGSRAHLGIPQTPRLIGTAGTLSRKKGLETFYRAWEAIQMKYPDVHLVLAGPTEPALPLPIGPRVHYLGSLSTPAVAALFQALDVGIITLEDSEFGRFCFPQKAYEMAACGLPMVAANVGDISSLFSETPHALYTPNDVPSLVEAIGQQLEKRTTIDGVVPTWEHLIGEFTSELTQLIQ